MKTDISAPTEVLVAATADIFGSAIAPLSRDDNTASMRRDR